MIYVSRIRLFIGEKKSRGTGAREIHLGSSIPTSRALLTILTTPHTK